MNPETVYVIFSCEITIIVYLNEHLKCRLACSSPAPVWNNNKVLTGNQLPLSIKQYSSYECYIQEMWGYTHHSPATTEDRTGNLLG